MTTMAVIIFGKYHVRCNILTFEVMVNVSIARFMIAKKNCLFSLLGGNYIFMFVLLEQFALSYSLFKQFHPVVDGNR